MKQPTNSYAVQSVDRAVELLFAFTPTASNQTLTQLAAKTGLPKPTAFRLLATLRKHGLVEFDDATGMYSLGFGLLRMADMRKHQTDLRTKARPIVERIRNTVNESVLVCVRSGDQRVNVDIAESFNSIRRTWEAGQFMSLYVGAASWVLLAGLTDEEISSYLERTELKAITNTTVTTRAGVWERVIEARRRGYVESFNERGIDGAGVAAPVRDHTGRVVAAICVSVPTGRYTEALRDACLKEIVEGAAEISKQLGHRAEGLGTSRRGWANG